MFVHLIIHVYTFIYVPIDEQLNVNDLMSKLLINVANQKKKEYS